ncbi:MAG: hypothetical protein R2851_10940 [Caldilineaceae bacterium]
MARPAVVTRPPDVLFVPAHVIPYVQPRRRLPPSVVTLHDLGYHFFPQQHTWRQRSTWVEHPLERPCGHA